MSTNTTRIFGVETVYNGQRITATGATYTAAIKKLQTIIKQGGKDATQGTGQTTATPAHTNQPDPYSTSPANANAVVSAEHAVTIA
jgi:hypothetical protein